MNKFIEEKIKADWEIKRKPIVSVPWTDYKNSSPIQDLREFQKALGNLCGIFGNVIEMNENTMDLIVSSDEFIDYVPGGDTDDIIKLLWGYNNSSSTISRQPICKIANYLPDGRVIVKAHSRDTMPWYKDLEATVNP